MYRNIYLKAGKYDYGMWHTSRDGCKWHRRVYATCLGIMYMDKAVYMHLEHKDD